MQRLAVPHTRWHLCGWLSSRQRVLGFLENKFCTWKQTTIETNETKPSHLIASFSFGTLSCHNFVSLEVKPTTGCMHCRQDGSFVGQLRLSFPRVDLFGDCGLQLTDMSRTCNLELETNPKKWSVHHPALWPSLSTPVRYISFWCEPSGSHV